MFKETIYSNNILAYEFSSEDTHINKKYYNDNYLVQEIDIDYQPYIYGQDYYIVTKVFDKNMFCRYEIITCNNESSLEINDDSLLQFINDLNFLLYNRDIYGLLGILEFDSEIKAEEIQHFIDRLLYDYTESLDWNSTIKEMIEKNSDLEYFSSLEIKNINFDADRNEHYITITPIFNAKLSYISKDFTHSGIANIKEEGDDFIIIVIDSSKGLKIKVPPKEFHHKYY